MSDHHADLVARLRGECWQYDGYLHTAAALIEKMAKEVERLREALEIYADPENYTPRECVVVDGSSEWEWIRPELPENEPGEVARNALKTLEAKP